MSDGYLEASVEDIVGKVYPHFTRVYLYDDEAFPVMMIGVPRTNEEFNVTIPTRLIAELKAAHALVKETEKKIKRYLTESGQISRDLA